MKKFVACIASVIFLAACAPTAKKTKLVFWHPFGPGDVGDATNAVVADFEKTHPNVKVEQLYISWGDFDTKLMSAITGGKPPDVVIIDRFVTATYAYRNALEPLDERIVKDKIRASDFFKACWEEGVYRGHVWSIPQHTDVRALYWRKDHFEEAGLDPEKPPKTWDELFEYAKLLTKYDEHGNIKRLGFLPSIGNWYIHGWAWQKGARFMTPDGRRVTCDEPPVVGALRWMVKFQDYFGRERVDTLLTRGGGQKYDLFVAGFLSMIVDVDGRNYMMKRYAPDVEYGVAPVPTPTGKNFISWSGGFALAIPKGSSKPDLAWEFIKFWISKKEQLRFCKIAWRIPALKAAAKDPFFMNNPHYKVLVELMKVTKYRPVTPVAQFYWDKLMEATQYALLHKKTPEQALKDCAKEVQAMLDKMY